MRAVGTGVFRSLAVAAAPFLTSAADKITEFGARISETFQRFIPIALDWVGRLWSGVQTVFSAIWGFVQPIVAGIGDFIVRNWQKWVQNTVAQTMAIWNAVSAAFAAIWGIVQKIGAGLVSAWNWAMEKLGFSTEDAGESATGIFQKLFDAAQWLSDKVTYFFNAIAFVIENWRDTLDLAVIKAVYNVVKFANEVKHFFGTVVPGYVKWFLDNWKDIFTTIGNFTAALFTNMYKNVTGFFKSVWSWLKGDGFDFKWTSLTEGFESTIKELPQIAEREIGNLERSLGEQAAILSEDYATKFAKYMAERKQAAEDAGKGITDAIKRAGEGAKPPEVPEPIIPKPVIPEPDTSGIEAIGTAAKAASDSLQAMFSRSAEAMRTRFAAKFTAKVGGSSGGSPQPTVAPVPAAATRAMRENAGNDNLMKQLIELIRTGTNRTLEDIRDGVRDGGLAIAGDI